MIQEYVDAFMAKKPELENSLREKRVEDYKDLVTRVIVAIQPEDSCGHPDPEKIHEINDGDYQGTLLYVIAEKTYQPDDYWYVKVGYGSCSGCDTLEAIQGYEDEPVSDKELEGTMTLALHIIQGLKEMKEESV